MSAPELHADDLLDKEARGELSPAERIRLDEHVQACSVCRFERQVRDDFRLEFETLGRADRKEAKERSGGRYSQRGVAATPRGRMSARVRLTLLAAAALLVTGAAAAEWETIKRTVFLSYVMEQSHAPSESPVATNAVIGKVGSLAAVPAEEKAAALQPAALEAPPVDTVAPQAVVESAPAKVASTKPLGEARPATPKQEPEVLPEAPSAEVAPAVQAPATADALFSAANDERQRGAYAEAIRLYRDLSQRFPQSPEATASHAIVGKLLLDRGDPSGALDQFDAYLQSGMTTLGEEARVGRASALERLGRSSEEAEAWSALLSAYPQSVHASRARSRLAKLGNR
jgi:TolA-binding protein